MEAVVVETVTADMTIADLTVVTETEATIVVGMTTELEP